MLRKIPFIACLFAFAVATAQQPYFKNYKVREGLPSNNVYYVFQDSKGYIWLCTDVGVSRFDGAHFTNFTTANGLTDNEVFSCIEDRAGRIWFATLNGKPAFYADGIMHSEKNTPLLKGFNLNGLVFNIHEEENGEIVMVSSTQMGRIDLQTQNAAITAFDKFAVQAWREKGLQMGLVLNLTMGFYEGKNFTPTVPLKELKVPVKHAQLNDTLYLTYATKLLVYDLARHALVQVVNLSDILSEAIAVSAVGNRLWIGDRKGVFLFDRKTLQLQQSYLQQSQVSGILEDREGGWWFSTLENGIFYVPTPAFLNYPSTTTDGKPLRVNCLATDAKGQLWAGMTDSHYGILQNKDWQIFQHYPTPLKPRSINSIRHFANGTTLLAGKAGVLRFQNGKRSFFRFRSSDANLDAKGNLWLGLTGLFFVEAERLNDYIMQDAQLIETIEPEFYLKNPPQNPSDLRVSKIIFDPNSKVWLASPNGLFSYKDGQLSQPYLPHTMRELYFDTAKGLLLALSESNGLYRLKDGQILDSIRIGNGTTDVIARAFCQDDGGNYWLATANGLFKIENRADSMKLVDYANFYGMGGESINAVAVHDGQVFMGKDDGLMAVPISIFATKPPPPPIYLKTVQTNERLIGELGLPLALPYAENALTFNFEGLSFKDFKKLHYRYRLLGHDSEWHNTANEAVEYASLRPGKYLFEVLAVNTAGVESLTPATIEFSIKPPFWMKWWFVLMATATIAGMVIFWVKMREQKLRRKYEMQRRLMESENERLELQKKNADLKMISLRFQMNPHFIFNALNTIKGYYGQDMITQANSYITKFAKLLRLNLDYSDAFIPLEKEVELLSIYLQLSQIRYPDKLEFIVDIATNIIPSTVFIPSMTIQPFVENAVIHGIVGMEGKGRIELFFEKSPENELLVRVRDNGIGREAAAQKSNLRDPHKPLATAITLERLQLLRKINDLPALEINDLTNDQGKASGTEVLLRLPVEVR